MVIGAVGPGLMPEDWDLGVERVFPAFLAASSAFSLSLRSSSVCLSLCDRVRIAL